MAFQDVGIRLTVLGVGQFRSNMAMARNEMNLMERDIGKLSISGKLTALSDGISRLGDHFMRLGTILTTTVTVPLLVTLGALIGAGINFEDAFAGVGKTVEGVMNDMGGLTQVGKEVREEFRQMALEIPISAVELAKIGEEAGQIGVSAENIAEFTKMMAEMGVSTNLTSVQAAESFARLSNVLGISEKDFLGWTESATAAVVALGNTSAATETEIVNMALRIAPAGRVVGLTTQEILGLATTLSEVGVASERGGTAISRVFLEMTEAMGEGTAGAQNMQISLSNLQPGLQSLRFLLEHGTTSLHDIQFQLRDTGLSFSGMSSILEDFEQGLVSVDDVVKFVSETTLMELEKGLDEGTTKIATFARIMGVSEEQFKAAFGAKPLETFQRFVVQLAKLQDEGRITSETLADIGLSGVRVREILNILGPNIELLTGNVELSNKAWIEQNALHIEAQKRFATTKSQLTLLLNTIKDLGITIFDLLKPAIDKTVKSLRNMVMQVKNLLQPAKKINENLKGVVLTVKDLEKQLAEEKHLKAFHKMLGQLATGFILLGPAMSMTGIALKGLSLALRFLTPLGLLLSLFTNPLLAIGMAAIAGGFILIKENIGGLGDTLKTVFDSFMRLSGIKQMFQEIIIAIKQGDWDAIWDAIKRGVEGMIYWFQNIGTPMLKDMLPKAVVDAFDTIAKGLGKIASGIKGFVDEIGKTDKEDVKQVLESIATGLGLVAAVLTVSFQLGLPVLAIGLRTIVNVVAELTRGDVAGALRALAGGLGDIKDKGLPGIAAAIIVLALAFQIPFVGALGSAVLAIGKLSVALWGLIIGPLGLILLPIALAIGLIYAYTKNIWGFKDAIDSIVPSLWDWWGVLNSIYQIAKWFYDHPDLGALGNAIMGSSTAPPGMPNVGTPVGGPLYGTPLGGTALDDRLRDWFGRERGGPLKGWGLVGEEGPELIYSKGTSMVFPNSITEGLLSSINASHGLTRALMSAANSVTAATQRVASYSSRVYAPTIQGVPMRDESSMSRELERSYRMAQMAYG